jgi:polysaccharide biosynthesis/export protein
MNCRCVRSFRRWRVWRLLFLALSSAVPSNAWAEYKVSAGDVLGLSVAGVAELSARATVDSDGNAAFPLIGRIFVAGSNLAEITEKVQAELPKKELDQRLQDGRTIPVIVSPAQIGIVIAEYRPVYITGDVAKPGELSYRPGMTVRQAVALAGGFDIVRFKLDNPLIQVTELTAEYNGLWVDYAKLQATVTRLQAELDGKVDLEIKNAAIGAPLAESLTAQIVKTEQDRLATRNQDFAKERGYLIAAAQKEAERARVLNEQESNELEGLKTDTADLDRYNDLFKKGAVAMPLLSLARRTVLESSTRALQTTAALASVERDEGDLNRKLERLGDVRRMDVLRDLQEATTQLASTRVKLQAVNTKLRYVGAAKTQLARGFDSRVTINVTRSSNGESVQITGSPDAELQPGDVAEIVLPTSDPVSTTQ